MFQVVRGNPSRFTGTAIIHAEFDGSLFDASFDSLGVTNGQFNDDELRFDTPDMLECVNGTNVIAAFVTTSPKRYATRLGYFGGDLVRFVREEEEKIEHPIFKINNQLPFYWSPLPLDSRYALHQEPSDVNIISTGRHSDVSGCVRNVLWGLRQYKYLLGQQHHVPLVRPPPDLTYLDILAQDHELTRYVLGTFVEPLLHEVYDDRMGEYTKISRELNLFFREDEPNGFPIRGFPAALTLLDRVILQSCGNAHKNFAIYNATHLLTALAAEDYLKARDLTSHILAQLDSSAQKR